MSATVYLVRHGRTALNAQRRFRGRADPPLDAAGMADASAAARRLADSGIRAVFTSPLQRSVQTAEVIARAVGVEPLIEGKLIDLDHGAWTARTAEEAAEAEPEAFTLFRQEPRRGAAPGGEAMQAVEERMFEALARIAEAHEAHDGGAAAAVSHEIPIRLVIAHLTTTSGPAFWDLELPTGGITRLEYENGAFSLLTERRMGDRR